MGNKENKNSNFKLNNEKHAQACVQTVGEFEGEHCKDQDQVIPDRWINKTTKTKIEDLIDYTKNLLSTMDDGRITISPYDTAWIALIKDLNGDDVPQFPSSLEWISNNQLLDGSWGDPHFFLAYDRLLNTLACVVALTFWNVRADNVQKGISFIRDNIGKLEDANVEEMTCGFEVVFPVLLQKAKDLGIDGIPYDDAPAMQKLYAIRDAKMKRVPKEVFHEVATCLLYNLEGLGNMKAFGKLDWTKLLKLQTPKGSFLTNPASTSFAVMETKDEHCLKFITYIVNKFNGGAPTVYPIDIYARLWAVDRLERLGISRFFQSEIKNLLDYIYSYWSEKGVFSARESEFCDIDDTSMGFRLLRLHGYDITPDALKYFKKESKFTCYVGQGFESPSPIFNLYRASQVQFPGETILEEAKEFSYKFLQQKLDQNQCLDKWLISKHLPEEVRTGLEMPWYATLPRVEARFFIENYGVDDIWIGKTLYRMPDINNEAYLELAKLDYNKCQAQHQMEWSSMQKWYEDLNLEEYGITRKDLLITYFIATATIFEPERCGERTAWIKSQILSNILFMEEDSDTDTLITLMSETLREIANDRDVHSLLLDVWRVGLKKLGQGDEASGQVGLLIQTINICGGRIVANDILSSNEYMDLSGLVTKICHQLRDIESRNDDHDQVTWKNDKYREIEKDMQLLVQSVMQETSIISRDIKQTFLVVTKSFYYRSFFTTQQIENHASRVLFHQVV